MPSDLQQTNRAKEGHVSGESACSLLEIFFFSSRRRHTRCSRDWSSDVCSSDLPAGEVSLRCLVVDDEPEVGAVLGDMLEAGGHRAVVVTDGGEAIARFGAEPFDLVFTDLAMPRVSGWQVARAIKEMAPAVPVIIVTGFGVELSAEERRAHNVDLVLVKPLKIQEILDVVAQLARRRVWRT